jgi:hypothetical protein
VYFSPHHATAGHPIRVNNTDEIHLLPRESTQGFVIKSVVDSAGNNVLVVEPYTKGSVK